MIQNLLAWITEFVGEYEPVTEIYSIEADTVITKIALGAAGVDWPWIAAAVAFLIGLWGAIVLIKTFLQGVFR